MRVSFWIMVILAISVQIAGAETVRVRSAEHEGFTRIVLDTARPEQAVVTQDGTTLEIALGRNTTQILGTDFYKKISKKTVLNFSTNDAARKIKLSLACECRFRKFTAGSKMLAIDIFDDDTVKQEVSEQVANKDAAIQMKAPQLKLSFGSIIESDASRSETKDRRVSEVEEVPEGFSLLAEEGQDLAQLRLLSNLRKASNQAAQGAVETAAPSASDGQIIFRSNPTPQASALQQVEQGANALLASCDEFSDFSPATWPSYEKAKEHLSADRRLVSAQADEFGDNTIRILARTYLSLAMGAEAAALLRALSEPAPMDRRFIDLAEFVDNGNSAELSRAIEDIGHCPGGVVWKLIEVGETRGGDASARALSDDELNKARLEFDRWPSALKNVFAARIGEVFLEYGAPDSASFLMRRSAEQSARPTGGQGILAAKIALKTQDAQAAEAILKPILAEDEDAAPQAAIDLADIVTAQGKGLEDDHKRALDIYREELKGTEIEADLIRARIEASLQEQDFATVIELLSPYRELVRRSQLDLVIDELGEAIFAVQSDVDYLREVVSLPARVFESIAQPIQERLKERVIFLGFEDLAEQLGQTQNAVNDGSTLQAATVSGGTGLGGEGAQGTSDRPDRAQGKDTSPPQDVAQGEKSKDPPIAANAAEPDIFPRGPIARAVQSTEGILDDVASLKSELAELGF